MNTENKVEPLSPTTVVMHWIVTVFLLVLLVVGFYMESTKAYDLYPLHKSFGFAALFAVVTRAIWRLMEGWPKPVGQYSMIEVLLSKLIHWVLLIASVLMPLSGLFMSYFGGHGIYVFTAEVVAKNPSLSDPTKVIALNETLASQAHTAHGVLAWILVAAIILHVVGGLKHHFIDKDGTMLRMRGKLND